MFYQISPDVALTTCIQVLLKEYPKSNSLDSLSMFLGFSAPKIGGVLMKTFSKGSSTRFFKKNGPRGGGAFYKISTDVALTTCMQLLLEMTPAICPLGPIHTVVEFSASKIGGGLHENLLRIVIYPIYFQTCPPESLSP